LILKKTFIPPATPPNMFLKCVLSNCVFLIVSHKFVIFQEEKTAIQKIETQHPTETKRIKPLEEITRLRVNIHLECVDHALFLCIVFHRVIKSLCSIKL